MDSHLGLVLALLLQNGTVSGRVLPMDEQPAAGVRIAAMAAPDGNSRTASDVLTSITETDAAGRYRLENIPPGRYYVIAGLVDFPTYYPGAVEISAARAVEVTARGASEGIDFTMRRPAALKVTGRIVRIPSPLLLKVLLLPTSGIPLEAEARADGSFEFAKVPPGAYTVRAPGIVPVSLAVKDKDVTIELSPAVDGPGEKVSGKVVGAGNLRKTGTPPAVVLTRIADPTANGFAGGVTRSDPRAPIAADGTFEFPQIKGGSYFVFTEPLFAAARARINVTDKDVTGIEIYIPFQLDITGRLVVENAPIPPAARVVFSVPNYATYLANMRPDGTFDVRVPEGDIQVALTELPPHYVVKSITDGTSDLVQNALKVHPLTTSKEIVVTLGTVPLDSIPGVRVSGRVNGPSDRARVSLFSGAASPVIDTAVNADGTFEFLKVLPGSHTVLMFGPTGSQQMPVTVADKEVVGIVFTVAAMATLSGRVALADANGNALPMLPNTFRLTFRRSSGYNSLVVRPDGTFSVSLVDGDYAVLFADGLPDGYSIKSMTSGAIDLKSASIKVTAAAPPDAIQITLEYTPKP